MTRIIVGAVSVVCLLTLLQCSSSPGVPISEIPTIPATLQESASTATPVPTPTRHRPRSYTPPPPADWHGQIAFVAQPEGQADIILVHSDAPQGSNLTNHPARDTSPAWSPDGSRIAFTSNRDSATIEGSHIYIMQADGSQVTQLTAQEGAGPVWSPDGRHIAFLLSAANTPGSAIAVIRSDGTHQTTLFTSTNTVSGLQWSPDGTHLAFSSEDQTTILSIDGSERMTIPNFWIAEWLPDGQYLLGVIETEIDVVARINTELASVRVDGMELTSLGVRGFSPKLSPDSTQIAYIDYDDIVGDHKIFLVNLDGTHRRRLTSIPVGSEAYPRWSPDGAFIAYQWSVIMQPHTLSIAEVDGEGVTNRATIIGLGGVWRPTGAAE